MRTDPRTQRPTTQSDRVQLGDLLHAKRRERRVSLRDLSAEIGVSLNTLSRVERGFVPDLKNFQRIAGWLDLPTDQLLAASGSKNEAPATPALIARHLHADANLSKQAAEQIAGLVQTMYEQLVGRPAELNVRMRSAQMFTPQAGRLLGEILKDMHDALPRTTPAK